jgi:hypothetical protein
VSAFEIVHQDRVVGKLVCFDRLIFKGHLTRLYPPGGLKGFLDRQGVLLKHFGRYARWLSETVKAHAQRTAAEAGRPYLYLEQTSTRRRGCSKEELARQIAERDGVSDGLICVLAAVEPCSSFDIYRNRGACRLELVRRRRKCLHFYYYFLDRELGFCHVRIQSWLPFEIQVWLNGREMLARTLEARRLPHVCYANAIVKVANFALAQRLADRLAARGWPRLLDRLARQVNPHLPLLRAGGAGSYWWVVDQAELATDIAFTSRRALEQILPGLLAHAASAFSAEDILRFLGRKLHPALAAEVTTDARRRPEGWRVKHRMARNTLKLYDKANVLRVETTINDPTQFRVLRHKNGRRCWCPLRKGVANLPRYYHAARAANERYLQALAAACDNRHGIAVLDRHTRPIRTRGRCYPRLNPLSRDELALYQALLAGEHAIVGFRNHHINQRLYPHPASCEQEANRRCARVSRLIAKLRGHGLVAKLPKQRRYRVTTHGQRFMTAALALHDRDFPAAYAIRAV